MLLWPNQSRRIAPPTFISISALASQSAMRSGVVTAAQTFSIGLL